MVGVIVSDDLKWQKNTDYICQKARTRLWTLRRLKKLNFDVLHIVDVYIKEVRSLLELAVPVWHSGLTKLQSAQIERVQKTAVHIILGEDYTNYDVACTSLGVKQLECRRERLCIKFAKKDLKSQRTMFTETKKTANTRAKLPKVKEIACRTNRFRNSALPYLTRLLNDN